MLESGWALGAANITDVELAVLPPYCAAKMKHDTDPAVVESWQRTFQHDNWIHMHHYCDALVEINRYYRDIKDIKLAGNLNNAIFNFDYVLKGFSKDFVLLPDVHYNKGRALLLKGDQPKAIAEFQNALALKPDFAQAALALANLYSDMKKPELAPGVLRQALNKAPYLASVRKKYMAMGGDPKLIPPQLEVGPTQAKPDPSPGAFAVNVFLVPIPPAAVPRDKAAPVALTAPQGSGEKSQNPVGTSGIPGNPWCRFCPEESSKLPPSK